VSFVAGSERVAGAGVTVVHLLATAEPAGTGHVRIVQGLGAGLDRERFRVVAVFVKGDGPLAAELMRDGVPSTVLSAGAGEPGLGAVIELWRLLRHLRPDIVHRHVGGPKLHALVRRTTNARVIAHLHGTVSETDDLNPAQYVSRGADCVIATSHAVAAQAPGPCHVIYPGVRAPAGETTLRPAHGGEIPVIGVASRLEPVKGISHLIRALAKLQATVGPVRLEIAGDGSQREALLAEARRQGVADGVVMLGWRADLAADLARWRVFAQPSLSEGFGIAALEAMAAGLPVVATRVGGVPELVEDGRTGWLVAPADPPALAARIGELLSDRNAAQAMGDAGRQRALRDFSESSMVQATQEVYERVLASRPARG